METSRKYRVLYGILSYLGILVLVPLALAKSDPFVKFHIRQGLVVFGIEVIVWILGSMTWPFLIILNIVSLITFVLSVIGIINVLQNREKPLPVVGDWAKVFKI